ncbi:ABC transporter substrate-binding protein [Pseudoflavonifractor sp. HCP28S3_F10]|uniref:ABC transporter substrate-binding protein n=1 Tax=Pseudoflavonifractor sp. HCP28S3_F10 TaxID=3438947 RepID=UPI003F8BA8C9
MKRKNALALALSLALTLGLLAGCGSKPAQPTASPSPAPTAEPTAAPSVEPTPAAERPEVSLAVLNGPTGMGAAKLIADNAAGTSLNAYNVQVAAQPTDLVGKLTSGEVDIAALPTNVAAALYHKTNGGVKLMALNTLGVLYILENGDTVHSMADLKGQTVYATGQGANPEYVLNYLLRENGLDPARDVTIEWKTAEEVQALMVSGEAKLAMLPVPAATGVVMQNKDVRLAVDFNQAWEDAGAEGTLTMGCIVARTAFLEEKPQAAENFLKEYADSISYITGGAEDAAKLVVDAGIVPKEPIAKAAIPQANLVCVTGEDMTGIQQYYEVLFEADPSSIGGGIPDDGFYYLP